jgi:hypothetical protein
MAAPTRYNDGRYGKQRLLNQRQEPLLDELKRLAENRPKAFFQLDDWVKTPIGWKRVNNRYYTNEGYRYSFSESGASILFAESELCPLPDTQFTPDSEVKFPNGQLAKVVGYAGSLVVVELRPKQLVGIHEAILRQHNPPTEYALRLMVRAFTCGDYLFEVDANRAAQKALSISNC